jgi:hypothetical protein
MVSKQYLDEAQSKGLVESALAELRLSNFNTEFDTGSVI